MQLDNQLSGVTYWGIVDEVKYISIFDTKNSHHWIYPLIEAQKRVSFKRVNLKSGHNKFH